MDFSPEDIDGISLSELFKGKKRKAKKAPAKEKKVKKTRQAFTTKGKRRVEPDPTDSMQRFLADLPADNSIIVGGIDPGVNGALALLHPCNPAKSWAFSLPHFKIAHQEKKKGKTRYYTQPDYVKIWEILSPLVSLGSRVVFCVEDVRSRPADTPLTALAIGKAVGMWPLFFVSHGWRYSTLYPLVWKKVMGLIGYDKEASRSLAQTLFLGAHLSLKKDEGKAEALLIAEAYKRKELNNNVGSNSRRKSKSTKRA